MKWSMFSSPHIFLNQNNWIPRGHAAVTYLFDGNLQMQFRWTFKPRRSYGNLQMQFQWTFKPRRSLVLRVSLGVPVTPALEDAIVEDWP